MAPIVTLLIILSFIFTAVCWYKGITKDNVDIALGSTMFFVAVLVVAVLLL